MIEKSVDANFPIRTIKGEYLGAIERNRISGPVLDRVASEACAVTLWAVEVTDLVVSSISLIEKEGLSLL